MCYRELESYTEADWSAMSGLEEDLERLDANYAEQFGEEPGTPSSGMYEVNGNTTSCSC